MKNLALVTGASRGIGLELARLHVQSGGDVMIVARNGDDLESVKSELENDYGVSVQVYVADLTQDGVPQQIYDFVKGQGNTVEVLINNAGFGYRGKFHEVAWSKYKTTIDLNVSALCEMTHLFSKDMVANKRGKILNVASSAGLLPGPLMAVYFASKAFVVSFSQAIAEELKDDGITVTALCPGPVATDLIQASDLDGISRFDNGVSPKSVAKVGYDAMLKGKLIAIDDRKLAFLLSWVAPLAPRWTLLKMSRQWLSKE